MRIKIYKVKEREWTDSAVKKLAEEVSPFKEHYEVDREMLHKKWKLMSHKVHNDQFLTPEEMKKNPRDSLTLLKKLEAAAKGYDGIEESTLMALTGARQDEEKLHKYFVKKLQQRPRNMNI